MNGRARRAATGKRAARRPAGAQARVRGARGDAGREPPAVAGTYLYCLVEGRRAPSLARAPAGLPGTGRPRALAVGDGLWLVAADAPLDRYGDSGIEARLRDLDWVTACAAAHEAVVEHVGRVRTVVPMKLFTIFRGDARAMAHVALARRRIAGVLARVAGRREWIVRVVFDEDRAVTRAAASARRPAGAGRGTGFLLARRRALAARRQVWADAGAAADRLYARLARRADDARRRPPLTGPRGGRHLVLDAAFLLPRGRGAAFRAAARRESGALRKAGCAVTVTGPWPPYSFVAGTA